LTFLPLFKGVDFFSTSKKDFSFSLQNKESTKNDIGGIEMSVLFMGILATIMGAVILQVFEPILTPLSEVIRKKPFETTVIVGLVAIIGLLVVATGV